MIEITEILGELSKERPVFHSEADFQRTEEPQNRRKREKRREASITRPKESVDDIKSILEK